ncbi:MAG TPA: helix-hairpin-helix domain-containing protein, partial [bacterium]|nr:helix-hairpin-helix domain-containing protein [bacterium]
AVSTAITAEKLPGIKTSVLTTLQAAFPSWEQLQQAGENDLTALDGIGPATAKKIVALIQ